jgi:hypothetical protein
MIALICTLEPYRISWLPQFVHHYRSIGVERFLLTLQLEPSTAEEARDRDYERFLATLTSLGIAEGYRWDHEWNAPAAIRNERMIADEKLGEKDWIVWCDSDELQIYPVSLAEIIRDCEAQRVDYLRGVFVDRVAADYSLAAFDAQTPLWDIFPNTVNVTLALARGDPRKIALARARIRVGGGKHALIDPRYLNTITGWVQIHHFKWDATLLDRLRFRVRPEWRERFPWWVESQRLLDYFAANHSRFNPADLTPIALTGRNFIALA